MLIPLFTIIVMIVACTNSDDYANPLDSENLRTSGSPDGLTLFPGDQEVRITWNKIAGDGVKEYRIYRRSNSKSDDKFELIGTVDAETNEFVDDQNIENDRKAEDDTNVAYEYRISYVDINGIETPNPESFLDDSADTLRVWPTATVTPSIAPPQPNVILGEETDLAVNLFWENYDAPSDLDLFRVYIAFYEGVEVPLDFKQVIELTRVQSYFVDDNFRHDNITKVYRVAAVDEFGVEGITEITATSPNLPPKPPKNFQAVYVRRNIFANTKYDVFFTWAENLEKDLDGYQIYTKDGADNLIPRSIIKPNETSITFPGEDPVVIDGSFFYKVFFITAFDDTPTLEGDRDESELVEAQGIY